MSPTGIVMGMLLGAVIAHGTIEVRRHLMRRRLERQIARTVAEIHAAIREIHEREEHLRAADAFLAEVQREVEP